MSTPGDVEYLDIQISRLLEFAKKSKVNDGGFGWLDENGIIDQSKNIQSWINSRMLYVFSAAKNIKIEGFDAEIEHGLTSLETVMFDQENGGWFREVSKSGPVDTNKTCYELAFVLLASSTAATNNKRAAQILNKALVIFEEHFWDEKYGMAKEIWSQDFTKLDSYRGVNANMHMVEALISVYHFTADLKWLKMALRITENVFQRAVKEYNLLIPEHFDENWNVIEDYNLTNQADPFRPYGVCVGHLYEWSRLAIHLNRGLGAAAPKWLLEDAKAIFDNAVKIGWAVDGSEGFVYTVDFAGKAVVTDRMHWVVTEAIAAAWSWHQVTKDSKYLELYAKWCRYADQYFVDKTNGSWRHECDQENKPSSHVWQGRPDVYHALNACLISKSKVDLISFVHPI